MKLQTRLAVLVCKASGAVLRRLGRGGTNLPGKLALKIDKNILGELSRGVKVTVVTGTNGKTTTSRMIEQAFADAGLKYFSNKSGANLLTGIIAVFAQHSTLSGKCPYTHALIECDEAAFRKTSEYLPVECLVVNNIFRDQLDRYGEVTHTLDNIRIGIENSKNAVLCVNADDSLCASLHDVLPNPVVFFGVDTPIYHDRVEELSDAPYCIRCKHEYVYDYVTYGHLGGYRCPNCGYHRPQPQVHVTKVLRTDDEHSEVIFEENGKQVPASIHLPGGYNIYNACACMAAASVMGIDMELAAKSLSSFACGFGRMEKFRINDADVRMILIKNPAGCNQVLNFLTQRTEPFVFAACLNDRAQDGKDVSWIWDVDFERLTAMEKVLSDIYVSGVRADDMALRFLYAGFPKERIHVQKDYAQLMQEATGKKLPVFVMPTYTAMLALRGTIAKRYGYKEFWQ